MSFVKFTGAGRNVPYAAISPEGMISFRVAAVEQFNMASYDTCVLYYDKDTARIGIELTDDKNAEGLRKLRQRMSGADVSARSFIEHFGIGYMETMVYPVRKDTDTGYLTLDLALGKKRAG